MYPDLFTISASGIICLLLLTTGFLLIREVRRNPLIYTWWFTALTVLALGPYYFGGLFLSAIILFDAIFG